MTRCPKCGLTQLAKGNQCKKCGAPLAASGAAPVKPRVSTPAARLCTGNGKWNSECSLKVKFNEILRHTMS